MSPSLSDQSQTPLLGSIAAQLKSLRTHVNPLPANVSNWAVSVACPVQNRSASTPTRPTFPDPDGTVVVGTVVVGTVVVGTVVVGTVVVGAVVVGVVVVGAVVTGVVPAAR